MKKRWIACLAVALVGVIAPGQGAAPGGLEKMRGGRMPRTLYPLERLSLARDPDKMRARLQGEIPGAQMRRPPARDLDKMQGKWTPTTFYYNEVMWPEVLQALSVAFRGNEMTVTLGPILMAKVDIRLDPSRVPKAYEHVIPDGPGKGKIIPGIYELDGDKLKISIAAFDEPRPKDYSVPEGKGSGRIVMILRRAK